jgi:hypothetical protein
MYSLLQAGYAILAFARKTIVHLSKTRTDNVDLLIKPIDFLCHAADDRPVD